MSLLHKKCMLHKKEPFKFTYTLIGEMQPLTHPIQAEASTVLKISKHHTCHSNRSELLQWCGLVMPTSLFFGTRKTQVLFAYCLEARQYLLGTSLSHLHRFLLPQVFQCCMKVHTHRGVPSPSIAKHYFTCKNIVNLYHEI